MSKYILYLITIIHWNSLQDVTKQTFTPDPRTGRIGGEGRGGGRERERGRPSWRELSKKSRNRDRVINLSLIYRTSLETFEIRSWRTNPTHNSLVHVNPSPSDHSISSPTPIQALGSSLALFGSALQPSDSTHFVLSLLPFDNISPLSSDN